MKILTSILATAAVLLFSNIYNQKIEKFSHQYSIVNPPEYLKFPVMEPAPDDSLNILKENYPAVYKKN